MLGENVLKKGFFLLVYNETAVLPSTARQPHFQGSLGGRGGASYFS